MAIQSLGYAQQAVYLGIDSVAEGIFTAGQTSDPSVIQDAIDVFSEAGTKAFDSSTAEHRSNNLLSRIQQN